MDKARITLTESPLYDVWDAPQQLTQIPADQVEFIFTWRHGLEFPERMPVRKHLGQLQNVLPLFFSGYRHPIWT